MSSSSRVRSAAWAVYLCIGVAAVSFHFTAGCGPSAVQVQLQTANAVAVSGNVALSILVERYRTEGIEVIGMAPTALAARQGLEQVDARWAPVWTAWEALVVADDAWATALEQGGDADAAFAALGRAYCGLRKVWPKDIPAVPLAPLRCDP